MAALSHFGHLAPIGLVSSGAPYGTLRFGISHPTAVEALASGDWFRVVTDGSGFGRADKVAMLARYPAALAAVKVCWEGDDPGRNCGSCEKCVMTRLNFLAAGIRDAPCFDTPLRPDLIAGLSLPSTHAVRDLFRQCWNELEARCCEGPEVDLLCRRLRRVPPEIVVAWRKKTRDDVARWLPRWVKQRIKRAIASWN